MPLSQPQTVVVEQEDGSRNEIVVTSEGAYMAFSSCDNQLCVHMGEVTLDNWETRPNQAFIICLPNRVNGGTDSRTIRKARRLWNAGEETIGLSAPAADAAAYGLYRPEREADE